MNENLIPFQPSTPARSDAAIYTGPDDVVGDRNLRTATKRAILASWVSDARAVENAPTLRRLDSGAAVEVATIIEALRQLDLSLGVGGDDPEKSSPSRKRGVVVPLPLRARRPQSLEDDEPPPTPARARIPPRPSYVDAYGSPLRFAVGAI